MCNLSELEIGGMDLCTITKASFTAFARLVLSNTLSPTVTEWTCLSGV